jgi:hypothetical protein
MLTSLRPVRSRRLVALVTALSALLCVVAQADTSAPADTASAQTKTQPPAWSPMSLDTTLAETDARRILAASAVDRATIGYLWTLPAFLHMRQRFTWTRAFTQVYGERGGNPFGQWFLMRQPASPETRDPSPNRDTLYGATFLDVGRSPYVLSVPDVPNRYWSIAMVDAWYYNFAYVGSRTTGQRAAHYLVVGPEWRGTPPAGIAQVIRAPTHSITMYQRIYFRDEQDVPAVQKIQDGIRLQPLARFLDPSASPAVMDPKEVLAVDPLAARDPVDMYRMVNAYIAANPAPQGERALADHVAQVGIGPGVTVPEDAASHEVLREGATRAQNILSAMAVAGLKVVNGWQIPPVGVARRGATADPYMQSLVQVRTIGLNEPEEATYYTTYTDGDGNALTGAHRYEMHFPADAIPPVLVDRFGFWSLTLYDREEYLLVDNPADKYLVRSGDPLVRGADGSLTLYLQPDPPQDRKLRANWLPTPAGRGFTLNLRVYLGRSDVVEGRWAPPAVRKR